MSEADNTQIAKDAYAAFGRRDIAAVLEVMADDIEWVFPGPPDVFPMRARLPGRKRLERGLEHSTRMSSSRCSSRESSSPRGTSS